MVERAGEEAREGPWGKGQGAVHSTRGKRHEPHMEKEKEKDQEKEEENGDGEREGEGEGEG